MSLAAAKEASMDAAKMGVLSELDGIFAFKEEQTDTEGFSQSKWRFLLYSRLAGGDTHVMSVPL